MSISFAIAQGLAHSRYKISLGRVGKATGLGQGQGPLAAERMVTSPREEGQGSCPEEAIAQDLEK